MYKRSAEAMESSTASVRDSAAPKQRSTRGARACTNCHRLKMKCEGAENGGACLRCTRGGHECIFLESNRGRKSDKRRKTVAMQQSLKKVEHLLVTLLQNMNDSSPSGSSPATAESVNNKLAHEGSASLDADISPQAVDMLVDRIRELVATDGLDQHQLQSVRGIAKQTAKFMEQLGLLDKVAPMNLLEPGRENFLRHLLHSALYGGGWRPRRTGLSQSAEAMDSTRLPHLPDNTLNPLGLFAHASLQNWQRTKQDSTRQQQVRPGKEQASAAGSSEASAASAAGDRSDASSQGSAKEPPRQIGVANVSYFHPSDKSSTGAPETEAHTPPELLTEGIITSEEALELFRIFFHHCALHMFLLDPEWHTPTFVCSRSPFLFTCVCAVASKFYTRRRDLYGQCQRRTIKSAFKVMSRGFKSTEIVQGFLLLTLYNQPVERYEEDRTWLFAGVAIRMAQDLNLHRKTVITKELMADENKMRDVLNRERTWYICFCVDRTLSAQMGKPYSIREDFLIRHTSEWCMQPLSRPWDLGICALVDLLRVQTRQLDFLYSSTVTPSGLNVDLDYPAILPSFNEQLSETMQFWYRLGLDSRTRSLYPADGPMTQGEMSQPPHPDSIATDTDASKGRFPRGHERDDDHRASLEPGLQSPMTGPEQPGMADTLRVSTLLALHQAGPPSEDADLNTRSIYYITRQAPLRYNYAILVLNSFGLQYALERPTDGVSADKPQYLVRCVHAAKEIIATVKYGMREILRYAPDPTFVAVAYACVFLLKLIQPMFAKHINEEEIIALVNHTIEVLEEAAVDPSHTPALYASFLRTLVQSRHDTSHDMSHGAAPAEDAGPTAPQSRAPGEAPMGGVADPAGPVPSPQRQSGTDPSLAPPPRSPAMTVNPTQVNPMVAELAADGMRASAPAVDINAPTLAIPMPSVPPLETGAPMDLPGAPDAFAGMHGWDAMQYAKAQGVDVNRVLDNSFWNSLLPLGYGSGGAVGSSAFDLSRESDLFRTPNLGSRTAITPGATRASSPTLMHGHFPL